MARTLKQTKTIDGSTSSSVWTWKQVVKEYFDSDYISTNESIIVVESYLGRPSGQSTQSFGGTATTEINCDGDERSETQNWIYGNNWIAGGNWFLIQSEEFEVRHEEDGTKTIYVSSSLSTGDFQPNSTDADGYMTLTTIPRASSISVNNYDLGQNPNIVIGKKVDSFTSTLSYKIGSRNGTLVEKHTKDNYVWDMNDELIEQIKIDNPTTKRVSAIIYCDTYDGNTKIGNTTSASFDLIIIDKPTIDNIVREELNSSVSELTDKVSRHISQNQFTITATAPTGTTIKGYRVKNGTQDSGQIESNVVTLNDIQSFYDDNGTLKTKFEVICIDARGNESEITEVICDFIDYIDVSINKTDVKVTRTNSTTNDAILSMKGNFYNGLIGDTQNKVNVNCQYRKQGTAEYSTLTDLNVTYEENTFKIDNLKLNGTFDYQENYEFVFYVIDGLNDSDETTYIFTSSIPTEIHHSKGAYIRELDTDVLTLGEVPIVESGSNENGEWIKWADGTMICTRIIEVNSVSVNQSWGSLYYYRDTNTYKFAQEFIAEPTNFQLMFLPTTPAGCWMGAYGTIPLTKSGFTEFTLLRPTINTVTGNLFVTAIGKWK